MVSTIGAINITIKSIIPKHHHPKTASFQNSIIPIMRFPRLKPWAMVEI